MLPSIQHHQKIASISERQRKEWNIEQTPQIFATSQRSLTKEFVLQTGLLFIRIGRKLVESTTPPTSWIEKTA